MTYAPCTMTARSFAPTPNYSTPSRRTYRAQVHRKHWTSNFDQRASQLRVEITLKKEQTMFTTLNKVWNIGSKFVGGLDILVVPISLYVNEVEHLLDVSCTQHHGRKAEFARPHYISNHKLLVHLQQRMLQFVRQPSMQQVLMRTRQQSQMLQQSSAVIFLILT